MTNAPWHHVRIQVDIYQDEMDAALADAVFKEIRQLLRDRRLEHEIRCQTIVTQQFRDTV